jgi:hypothetical protein
LAKHSLQARLPGIFPNGQLRTLQRHVKHWRTEIARRLVMGDGADTDPDIAALANPGEELLK